MTPVPPPRVLILGPSLLMAGLLLLAVVRSPGPWTVVTVLVTLVVLVPGMITGGRSDHALRWWLVVLWPAWAGVLVVAPEAVWSAFPMFILQLVLLPTRWAPVAVAVTTLAAVVGFGPHHGGFTVAGVLGPVLGAAVTTAAVLGYQASRRESENRRRLLAELTSAREDLDAAQRTAGVLAERERLAREIHDTLAQGLSSIQLLLRAAEREAGRDPTAAAGHITLARHTARDNLAEARRFVRGLAPPGLDGGSLAVALRELGASTARLGGLAVHCHVDGDPVPVPVPHEVALLRIAQSALANVTRHARARRVDMTLTYMDTAVTLDVVDDGVGFDPERATGFGLAAMRDRVTALGGSLTVESAPGRGTALAAVLDLDPVGSA